ncbi:MAG: PilZ domain-containing protein [Paraglaciecola chathamensis]
MNQDFEQYHDIIEQLKPMINEPEFGQILTQVAGSVPKQKRFLLKMELKRLARPCTRLIDLRGYVDGKCKLYEYEDQQHFLDDIAIEVFERQVRSFGEYSVGVYEAVMNTENNYRVMHKKEQQASLQPTQPEEDSTPASQQYLAPIMPFGEYAQRSEERMNYSMSVELFTETNKSMLATTVDVSLSGLKLKISKEYRFKSGERLAVQFRGLEHEYMLDNRQGVQYVIESVERNAQDQRLHLKRLFDTLMPSFDRFLERFIHGNKRRYKVNLDNTFDAIHKKTYEQYYIPNFTSIPVYIESTDDQFAPRYALANDCNRQDIFYWNNEINDLKLGYLFSDARIKQCLSYPKGSQETYLYVFHHIKNEKVYFYSASHEELIANASLRDLYLSYGSRKISWRVYKLQIQEVEPKQSHRPLSIADSISESVKRQNQPPTPRLMSRLRHLSHIALLTNVTDDANTLCYQNLPLERAKLPSLKVFGHPRNRSPENIQVFRFKYANQRRESRFMLRTAIQLKVEDMIIEGHTEDISIQGIKLELKSFFHKSTDSQVEVNFPQLQKVTRKYDLSNLSYTVRHISNERNVLHLSVVNDENSTTTKAFFDELIKNNRSKLKAYRDEEDIPGIGEALRNIYANNVPNVAFFIRKEGAKYLPDATATWAGQTRLTNLLSFQAPLGEFNLLPLFEGFNGPMDFIQHTLSHIKPHQRPVMSELFVAFNPKKESASEAIKSCYIEQFANDDQRRQFISQALEQGQFIALKIFIARTGRPDIDRLQSEINYVGVYAVHRAKQLEEKLWNVNGVGDILDITDLVMSRYQFDALTIHDNRERQQYQAHKSTEIEQLLNSDQP